MLATIQPVRIWQTTSLDCAIAEEFFGWKWMAFPDIPVRGTPGYPQKCIVRQFLSPKALANPEWQEFLNESGYEANGDEPLAYCYCSSAGPAIVPHYSGDFNDVREVEAVLRKRKLWKQYRKQLWAQIGGKGKINEARLWASKCGPRCIAALAVIGSKYVTTEPA